MISMRTLRDDLPKTDSVILLPGEIVQRHLTTGRLVLDKTKSQKFSNIDRYSRAYNVEFPEIKCRFTSNVTVYDVIAFDEYGPLLDNLHRFDPEAPKGAPLDPIMVSRVEAAYLDWRAYEGDYERSDTLTLIFNNEGGATWGHWVVQLFPKVVLFLKVFPEAQVAVPAHYKNRSFGKLLALFGVPERSLFYYSKPFCVGRAAFVDRLFRDGATHPWVVDFFKAAAAKAAVASADRIFVERAKVSSREISNIAEVKAIMENCGFSARPMGGQDIATQIACWRRAKHVASTLGSDLTNMVFANPGLSSSVISLDAHGDRFFLDLAAAFGHVWNEVLCGSITEERVPRHQSSFSVTSLALTRLLNQEFR